MPETVLDLLARAIEICEDPKLEVILTAIAADLVTDANLDRLYEICSEHNKFQLDELIAQKQLN